MRDSHRPGFPLRVNTAPRTSPPLFSRHVFFGRNGHFPVTLLKAEMVKLSNRSGSLAALLMFGSEIGEDGFDLIVCMKMISSSYPRSCFQNCARYFYSQRAIEIDRDAVFVGPEQMLSILRWCSEELG